VLAAIVFAVFGSYWIPKLVVSLMPTQDLKRKYDAQWALVTGSSSGIGKSLASRLASQGLNIVMVALNDRLLDDAVSELDIIAEATKDLDVQIVFNNAGFMLTGFFDKQPLSKLMLNHECNATSAMQITHLFVTRMLAKNMKGCVVFTSSAAACQPTPFSALYGATKSYISSFAANIAVELKSRGIDVCAVHPSPVASNFYEKAHKLDSLNFFMNFAVQPDALPQEIFRPIGRVVWYDIGGVAIGFRMLLKLIDYGCFATFISYFAHALGDFKKNI